MGFGLKEPSVAQERLVPGTVYLYENAIEHDATLASVSHLKHSQKGAVLSPQPTTSPNDPLNWPAWKKHLCLFFVALINGLNESFTILFSPISGILVKQFKIDFAEVAQLQGLPLLTLGFGGILYIPFSRWFGKRPVYIFGVLVLFATTIWIIYAPNYNSLLAARGLNGFGNSAFNSMSVATIGDMYFVHERGSKIQLLYLFNVGCLATAPILGGWIAFHHSWQLLYKIGAGIYGAAIIATILFIPETTYIRPAAYETDVASTKDLILEAAAMETADTKEVVTTETVPVSPGLSFDEKPQSFLRQLAPFTGKIYYRENPLQLIARSFVCMLYPAVLISSLSVSVYGLWAVGATVTLAQVYSPPPAHFNAAQLGYTYTFPAVGAFLGYLLGTTLLDRVSNWAARRNGGVFEPEFRLFLVIPMYIIGVTGFFLFGYYASTKNPHWIPASAILGLIYFGYMIASSVSYAYILDCHRNYAAEMTVALTLLRSALSYGSTKFLPIWLEHSGTRTTYFAVGGIEIAMFFVTVVAYMYGKVLREFIHRHNLIDMLHV
ncbi:MAG: hypothetical protein M1820_004386 [Bogoriella megaspora]|nr:MAG: hypothetical protein M1820_004386 [Bogoriella megaspora]